MRLFNVFKRQQPPEKKTGAMVYGIASPTLMNRNYRAFANEGYSQNSVVKACVDKIAQSLSSVDLYVYRDVGGKLKKLDGHELEVLMDRPNPMMSGRQFRQALVSYYLIGGNAYTFGLGMDRSKKLPKELHLLTPSGVTVKEGKSTFPYAYEYTTANETKQTYLVDQLTGRSQVLHTKTFNPLCQWTGLSPMVAAAFGIDVFNAGQRWNLSLLQNGARPSGALVVQGKDGPQTLTEDQFSRLREMMDEQFSGATNSGRPLILEGGLDWREMSMNPKDMDFRESILTMARFVASVYGVPPMLVNIPGESTYSNFEQARTALWTDTVLPLLATILDDFNRWFSPILGEGVYLWYDEEMIPALEPLRKSKADRINAATYMTVDEKRQAMGLEAYSPTETPGGTILVQSSNIPLELASASMDIPADKPTEPPVPAK